MCGWFRSGGATMLLCAMGPAAAQAGILPPSASSSLKSEQAPADSEIAEMRATYDRSVEALMAHRAAEAVAGFAVVAAHFDHLHAHDMRQLFCARTQEESVRYLIVASAAKRDTAVLDSLWSDAVFFQGFALIDLDRAAEARPLLDRAVALSPSNAQYLAELAEWHKGAHNWPEAYALFQRAVEAADLSRAAERDGHRRRGMRGMGFVLIEQGKLDEAEVIFRRVLAADPDDAGAKRELDYISTQRANAKSSPRA